MITIAGAGVAGLASAYELAKAGAKVRIYEAAPKIGQASASRFAGGMLAPWCESERAGPQVTRLGESAADWWAQVTSVQRRGTLVLAPNRDQPELQRFARRTAGHRAIDAETIAALEPSLVGRFRQGLFFEQEAHLNPRQALDDLATAVQTLGVDLRLNTPAPGHVDLDCTGICADLPDLRAVRGEMALLHCPEVDISRTLRLLHPRFPIYLVPREAGHFMLGATMIESASERPPTLRSLSELFAAAFTLHPAFAEAAVVETGAGLRPALPDNMPTLRRQDGTLYLNGLYRHGFLLAPAMAAQVTQHLIPESTNANCRQRQTA